MPRGHKSRERRLRLQEETRRTIELEAVVEAAATNAIFDYAMLVDVVAPWARQYDGTEQGKLDFLAKCRFSSFTSEQFKDASWILEDLMSDHARKVEKSRQIGQSADEVLGQFNLAWMLEMIEKNGESEIFKPVPPPSE